MRPITYVTVLMAVLVALPAAAVTGPPRACLPPHDRHSWCDTAQPAAARAGALAAALTVEELAAMMEDSTPAISRLGIPDYNYGYEALHGMINTCPFADRCFTSFPCSSAAAAAFNRSLWFQVGAAQIDEMRGMYNDQHELSPGGKNPMRGLHVRGPQLNPQREPRWGRNDNSPGEDAYLEGQYGAFMVRGGQGADFDGTYKYGEKRKAVCEMKHFDAYSVEDGRNGATDDFNISLRDLANYYFVPLKACIELADVGAYMCSYNAINGTAACGNRWLNVEVARKTWGFGGVVESDCGAISGIQDHGNAGSQAEAAVAAVRASVDVACDSAYQNNLLNITRHGMVDRTQLEAAAARVLEGRIRVGQFDPPGDVNDDDAPPWNALTADEVFSEAHQALSLEAAEQSVVLLRNPPVEKSGAAHLPLSPERVRRVAVVGPNGNVADVFQGQYHGTNCPGSTNWNGSYDCLPTAFDAIQDAVKKTNGTATYHNGCALSPSASDGSGHPEGQPCASLTGINEVLQAAEAADVVILFLGLDIKMTNKEGQDRAHNASGYALPGQQQELARQLHEKTKTPIVVVVLSGMAVGMDYIAGQDDMPLVIGGYGGRFGPYAIANVLFGKTSPTGRLPYTIYPEVWASNTGMTDMSLTGGDGRTYIWYKGAAPLPFSFGAGLTYTTFKTSVTSVMAAGTGMSFAVVVTNTGNYTTQQTLMLFARPVSVQNGPNPLPNRRLFDFGRTQDLAPGETQTLSFTVTDESVALADWTGALKAFVGKYVIEFWTGEGDPNGSIEYEVSKVTTYSTLPPPLQ